MSAAAKKNNVVEILPVRGGRQGRTLAECVGAALEDYFDTLGGQDPSALYQMVLLEMEKPLLESVMARSNGNQSRAAEILGINRSTLRKKLQAHNLV